MPIHTALLSLRRTLSEEYRKGHYQTPDRGPCSSMTARSPGLLRKKGRPVPEYPASAPINSITPALPAAPRRRHCLQLLWPASHRTEIPCY